MPPTRKNEPELIHEVREYPQAQSANEGDHVPRFPAVHEIARSDHAEKEFDEKLQGIHRSIIAWMRQHPEVPEEIDALTARFRAGAGPSARPRPQRCAKWHKSRASPRTDAGNKNRARPHLGGPDPPPIGQKGIVAPPGRTRVDQLKAIPAPVKCGPAAGNQPLVLSANRGACRVADRNRQEHLLIATSGSRQANEMHARIRGGRGPVTEFSAGETTAPAGPSSTPYPPDGQSGPGRSRSGVVGQPARTSTERHSGLRT